MMDYYTEAVRLWGESNKRLKLFAECCAKVEGRMTASLAADCNLSVDTVRDYGNAYRLYYELTVILETSEPARIWEKANLSLWVKAAQLKTRYNLTPDKVMDYLNTASEEGMTREQFAAVIDTKENGTPVWMRRLKRVSRILIGANDDWKTDMPIAQRTRYEQAVDVFSSELEAIAEMETE